MIYLTSKNISKDVLESDIQICDIKFIKDYFKNIDLVGVDTETTGFDPNKDKVLTLQLGHRENQFVIDALTIDILEFKDILENKELILQNAKFDLRFFYKHNIWPNKIYDTFLAETKLYQGILNRKKNLEALAIEYCNTIDVDKSLRGRIHYEGLSPIVIKYAANDVKFLHEIREKQLLKAEEEGLIKAVNLENRFVSCLAYTEFCGMYFNPTLWSKKVSKSLEELNKAKEILDDFVRDNNYSKYIDNQLDLFEPNKKKKVLINWNSDKQVKPLFKDLNINVIVSDKGKEKESIEAKSLEKQEKDFLIIRLYLNFKRWVKDYTTYGDAFLKHIHPTTGRIHTQFTQIVDTGRMASGGKNKNTKEEYPNFQNIPATPDKNNRIEGMIYARECIRPEGNNIFVNADYSGQEDIVFVNKSKEQKLIDFYNQPGKPDGHSFVAKLCYPEELKDITIDNVKKERPDLRSRSKKAKFAIHYGGNGYTVATNLNLPRKEGDDFEAAYYKAFPGISAYFDKCEKDALEKGYILIDEITGSRFYLAGFDKLRRLMFEQDNLPKDFWKTYQEERSKNSKWFREQKEKNSYINRWKGQIRRNALNSPIQGTAASITKIAGIYFYDWLLNNNYQNIIKIVNIIHDEYLVECPKELSNLVADKLKEFMEKAGDIYCKIVPLRAEPEISLWWNH